MAAQFKPTIEELVERNKEYAATHKPIPLLMERMHNDPKSYGPHLVIISCFDSRANPFDFLSIQPRECLILRNPGGRFASASADIAALDTLFHVSQLILVHHSNCGTSHITRQAAFDGVRAKRPDFTDWEQLEERLPVKEDDHMSLLEDFERVRKCGFLRRDLVDGVVGFWLDVKTGLVRRVWPDGSVGEV